MNTRRSILTAAIGAAAAIGIGAGPAAAAPTGSSATETIAQLQASGSRVVVDKVGAGPMDQCTVTSVRPVQTPQLPMAGNPQVGLPVQPSVMIVHVGLRC